MELYGDQGTAVGNPELQSEKGVGGDVGIVYKKKNFARVLTRLYGQAAFFGRNVDRLIGWFKTPNERP